MKAYLMNSNELKKQLACCHGNQKWRLNQPIFKNWDDLPRNIDIYLQKMSNKLLYSNYALKTH